MKQLSFLFVLFLGLNLFGQCPPGYVHLSSQAQVDQFLIDYPNCTKISGTFIIGSMSTTVSSNITDLTPLSNLTEVTDQLLIRWCPNLQSLSGLNSITSVESLAIYLCNSLTSITDLNGLTTVNRPLCAPNQSFSVGINISRCNALTSVTFQNLTTVPGAIKIDVPVPIQTISAPLLNNVGSIHLWTNGSNSVYPTISFPALVTIQDRLRIEGTGISALNGFSNLQNVGAIQFVSNDQLLSLAGLSSLTSINTLNFSCASSPILEITGNNQLSFSSIPAVCNFISAGNLATISSNATGSNSTSEISAVCGLLNSTTQLSTLSCGLQLNSFGEVFFCDPVANATHYEFEFTELNPSGVPTTSVTYHTENTNSTSLLSAGLVTNNVNYHVRVRATVGSSGGSFGAICVLYGPQDPITYLTNVSCGAQLTTINDLFFCAPIANATQYKFEFTELDLSGNPTTTITYHTENTNSTNLLSAGLTTNNISYQVRVIALVGTAWTNYGFPCLLHSPQGPTTSLTTQFCGAQLTTINEMFFCDPIANATQYEFEFTELDHFGTPTTIVTYHTENTNSSDLQSAGLSTNNVSYHVRVRALIGNVWTIFGSICNLNSPQSQITHLTNTYCGAQLTSSSHLFYCYPVANATQYEFEYAELDAFGATVNVTTHTTTNPSDNLIDAGVPYVDVSYNVRVRAQVNGIWSAFGPICQLNAQDLPPTTQISVSFCNYQLTIFNETFTCNSVIGATEYEFEFVELNNMGMPTGNIFIDVRTWHTESLSMAGIISLNTTYFVRVRAKVNGVWGDFGNGCYIHSPQTVPTTELTSLYCNTTLSSIGQSFSCNTVAGATQYRFRISESGSTASPTLYTNTWNTCDLISAGFSAFNTVYEVEVSAFLAGVWGSYGTLCYIMSPVSAPATQLQASWCGATLATFSEIFTCDAVSGATEYEYRFTDTNPNSAVIYTNTRQNTTTNRLTFVPNLPANLATTYDVIVRAKIGNTWGAYGPTCQITTPVIVGQTQLNTASCGLQLNSFGQVFNCNSVPNASEYEFEFTDQATSAVYTNTRFHHSNKLTHVTGFPQTLGTVYDVRVRAKIGNTWGTFGNTCALTTPQSVPTTQLSAAHCNTTLSNIAQTFGCNSVQGANEYEFEITQLTTNGSPVGIPTIHPRNWHTEKLTWAGFSALLTTYEVRVRARIGSNWGSWGTMCNITTGSAMLLNSGIESQKISDVTVSETGTGSLTVLENRTYELSIYPNPASDILNINTDVKNYSATIISLNGQIIQSQSNINGKCSFDLEAAAAGIYLLVIRDEFDQTLKSSKINVVK